MRIARKPPLHPQQMRQPAVSGKKVATSVQLAVAAVRSSVWKCRAQPSSSRQGLLRTIKEPHFPRSYLLRHIQVLDREPAWVGKAPRLRRQILTRLIAERCAIFRELRSWMDMSAKAEDHFPLPSPPPSGAGETFFPRRRPDLCARAWSLKCFTARPGATSSPQRARRSWRCRAVKR